MKSWLGTWSFFLDSLFLRYSLCRLAWCSHLVCPGLGGSWHSRHLAGPPAAIFSASAIARASSLASFPLAYRLAPVALQATLCFSAHSSHLVSSSLAGLPQPRQSPRALAVCSFSFCRVLRLSFLSSRVSVVLCFLGPFGRVGFLDFCRFVAPLLFFLTGAGNETASTKSCLLGCCIPLLSVQCTGGYPVGDPGLRGRIPLAYRNGVRDGEKRRGAGRVRDPHLGWLASPCGPVPAGRSFSAEPATGLGGGEMPRITRPQVYRVVREMLPRERFGPEELLRWLEDTQDSNERARRSHAKRRAAMRASPHIPP